MLEDIELAEGALPPPDEPLVHALAVVGVAAGQGPHLRPHQQRVQAHGAVPRRPALPVPRAHPLQLQPVTAVPACVTAW